MTLHNRGRGPVLLRHGLRRKEKQHSLNSGIPPFISFFSFFLFPSLFLFRRREGGKEGTVDCVKGCRVHEGDRQLLKPRSVTTEEVKRLSPHKAKKGAR
jgi:hypothetical protein